jgi:hypothetical protein
MCQREEGRRSEDRVSEVRSQKSEVRVSEDRATEAEVDVVKI